jgi:two-component system, OmpR family, sensor kinase
MMAAPSPTAPAAGAPGPAGRPRTGLWRSLVQFSARTPLRVKLITTVLVLVIAALALISIAGVFVLRNYLNTSADQQVTALFERFDGQLLDGQYPGGVQGSCFGQYMEAFVPTGDQLGTCQNGAPSLPRLPGASWLKTNSGQFATVPARSGNDTWRLYTKQTVVSGQFGPVAGTLITGEDLGNINHTINRLVSIDLVVGGIVVFCLAIVGVAVVRTSMQPLTEIERTAGKIAAGDLTQRVTERDPGTEVGSLGRSLNVMLARIEAAFHAQATSEANARASENRMRRFIADASHELRTPLTTIRGYAEYYRQRGGITQGGKSKLEREDLDRIMQRVEDEAARMGGLVEDLLTLARIDQQRPLDRYPVDVLALAADAVQDARMVAPGREITLTVGRDTAFLVLGDESRLRQVIGNLTGNALTHTPDGTPVQVHVRSGQIGWSPSGPVVIAGPDVPPGLVPPPPGAVAHAVPAVVIEVVDHGPGLSPEQMQRVFERFYRADEARTRQTGGTGLGLAIVNALVTAHGGAVAVESAPGRGATFRVALPLAPEAQGYEEEEEDPGDAPPAPGDDAEAGQEAWGAGPQGDGGPVWAPPPAAPSPFTPPAWPAGPGTADGPAAPGDGHGPDGHGPDGPEIEQRPSPEPWEPAELPDVVEQRRWKPFS